MKKLIAVMMLCIAFAGFLPAGAQSRGDQLMKQAQTSLDNKEYVKARYCFLQAYNAFAARSRTDKAVVCAVNTAALYHREGYYKEAFEVLSRLDGILSDAETASSKPRPNCTTRYIRSAC